MTVAAVQYLKGVGPKLAKILGRLGIKTTEDLLYFFPRDYEDRRNLAPISSLHDGQLALIKGEVLDIETQQTRSKFSLLKVTLADHSGQIKALWFNQPFLKKLFRPGLKLYIAGKVEYNRFQGGIQLSVRDFEIDTGELPGIVPIYPLTEGLYPKKLRQIIKQALETGLKQVADPLPENILRHFRLQPLKAAIENLHFPHDQKSLQGSRFRLIFDDFFIFQLGLGLRRRFFKEIPAGISFRAGGGKIEAFLSALPFALTGAQSRVFKEIQQDMASPRPMNRLLQGDVGSGKTMIAALSAVIAIENGYQAAIMAPTEILAQQHYKQMRQLFGPHGVTVELLTGSLPAKEKRSLLQRLIKGEVQLLVGTHALIEEGVKYRKLGLAVVDEQHRFGVKQRAILRQAQNPDMLFMTATPIPRSLALTLYGDLDRSLLDEMPPGRTPIKTYFVPETKQSAAYEFMREQIKRGQQVYFVYPLVEESEELDLKNATDEAQRLQKEVYPEYKVVLVHGRMKADEKEKAMQEFKEGRAPILVSTTVIEVGIDVPSASVMVIVHAERFGLSQLHQLRGRVGRGALESYCFLEGRPKTPEAQARIKAMLESHDGFYLAEADLKLRGPGDFYGTRQSGLPAFRLADLVRDSEILQTARQAAQDLLKHDPALEHPGHTLLKTALLERFGKFLDLGALQ